MIHFLIDFDDTVKTLLLCDDTIVELREVDYTLDLLDKLFVQLSKYKVDKLSVITHGTLSACLYENGCVAYELSIGGETVLCSVNEDDVNAVQMLADRCGIQDVKFYDKLGYYLALGHKGVCYVDSYNGMRTLLAVDANSVLKMSVCSRSDDKLESFCSENNLQSVCEGVDLTDADNLMFFTNSATMLDDVATVHDLSVFAYACLDMCELTSFGLEVLSRNSKNITSVEGDVTQSEHDDQILQVEDLEDSLLSEAVKPEKKKPGLLTKNKTSKSDNKSSKLPAEVGATDKKSDKKATFVMLASIICILIAGGIVFENYYLQKKLTSAREEITNVQAMISSTSATKSAYEYCLNTEGNQILMLFNQLSDSISDNNGTVINSTYDSNGSSLQVRFDSLDAATAFTDSVNLINAQASLQEEPESDDGTCLVTVQMNE